MKATNDKYVVMVHVKLSDTREDVIKLQVERVERDEHGNVVLHCNADVDELHYV